MAMVKQRHIQKQQSLREAEGYLELLQPSLAKSLPLELRRPLGERALSALDRVGDFGAWSSHACYLRGQALRMIDRFADAVGPLSQAAELDHDNLGIWLALGWCHKRCHRLDLAIEALEEALIFAPKQAILHYNLACYWSLARHVPHAVMYLAQAFELDAHYRELVADEHDFDPIREHPEFQAINSVIV
jgi:tetratricopeptide (TPR) repeat protein